MKIHHVGYAVKDIDTALKDFSVLGYLPVTEKCIDALRNVYIVFIQNGDYVIELVSPVNDASPIGAILKKLGSTPYHLCYETTAMAASIESLKERGFVLIAEPLEAPAIEIRRVAFLFKDSLGVIELVEA